MPEMVSILPPFLRIRESLRNGPQRARARRFCAAKRTLAGEDRSARLERKERGLVGLLPQLVEIDQPSSGPSNDNSRHECWLPTWGWPTAALENSCCRHREHHKSVAPARSSQRSGKILY